MASTITETPFDEAVKLVCANNIHQYLWLPQTPTHDRLRVSFSTTSNFHKDTLPVVLFCVPMFGSRYYTVDIDHLAVTAGVRAICVDRPGMGASTPVPLDQRISIWLETVPALLKHLNVPYVSIMSHSAGTMYALHTIYHLRHLLSPTAPYAGLIAPWVSTAQSNVMIWQMAASLPTGAMNAWSSILGFVNNRIMPVTAWSGGVVSSSANWFTAATDKIDPGSHESAEHFGVSTDEVAAQISNLQMKYKFAESITAVNEELKLCLKKGCEWGICDDHEKYVRELAKKERDGPSDQQGRGKLRVDVFFAETDIMIGKEGQQYFERSWRQDGVSESVEYVGEELKGTDHETAVLDHEKGAVKIIFDRVARQATK